jgi:hypothetical protein
MGVDWGFAKTKDVTCSLSIDYPEDTIPNASGICHWLVDIVNRSISWSNDFVPYAGNPKDKEALARFYSEQYFALLDSWCYDDSFSPLWYDFTMSAYAQNARYVTYFLYTMDYSGGPHHNYTERLASFDLNTGKEITPEYLFRPDCLDKVRMALLIAVSKDAKFREWNGPETTMTEILNILADHHGMKSEEKESIQSLLSRVNISRMGLTPEGVVVSFFPYEIHCFAAGCFHFLIPYKDIYSYLSDEGKRCVGTL